MSAAAAATGAQHASGAPAARPPAPFVLVTGGKGGVGKSTVCANLALALARKGLRVLLVDLDLGLANLDVLLRSHGPFTLEDYLCGAVDLEQVVRRAAPGVDLLPAGSGSGEMARLDEPRRERLRQAVADFSAGYDLLLADSAAGIGPEVLAFAAAADQVLIVTQDEPAALTDAYGLVKALDAYSREIGREIPTPELVVNLAGGAEQAEHAAGKLRTVSERFLSRSPRLAGWLPRCAEVLRSASTQRPFVLESPRSLSARCVDLLAGRLCRLSTPPRALLKV